MWYQHGISILDATVAHKRPFTIWAWSPISTRLALLTLIKGHYWDKGPLSIIIIINIQQNLVYKSYNCLHVYYVTFNGSCSSNVKKVILGL